MLQVLLARPFPLLVNDDQRAQFVVGIVPIGQQPLRDFGRERGEGNVIMRPLYQGLKLEGMAKTKI